MKIPIKGVIIGNDDQWIYDLFEIEATSPKKVSDLILAANGEDLEVDINSPGGYVTDGSEIYTMLKSYNGNVTGNILGMAASSASIIAMGCKVLNISPTAQIMIHNAANISVGDYRDHEKSAEMLKKTNLSIANSYRIKSGMSEEEVLKMMDEETFFTAQEALDKNLVDGIMFDSENALKLVANVSGSSIIPESVINKIRNEKLGSALNLKQPQKEKEGDEDIMNLAELKEKHPDIYNQVIQEGATNAIKTERERISALNDLASAPGASEIVNEYIENGKTAGEAAVAILKASAEKNKNVGENRTKDSVNSGADKVLPTSETDPVSNTKSDEEEWKAEEEAAKKAAEVVNKSRGVRV